MKEHFQKSSTNKLSRLYKQNSLEYYISKNISNKTWWNRKDSNETSFTRPIDSLIRQFLKKDIKITKVIPNEMKKINETPDNLGYFDSRFGTFSIGHKKHNKNGDISFSLIPEKTVKEESIPSPKIDSINTYFAGESDKDKKTFKASELSFLYDKSDGKIKKVSDNDMSEKEENLLYKSNKEQVRIEELKKIQEKGSLSTRANINKEISNIRETKRAKEKKNLDFIKEIREILNKIKYGKLRKVIESDETISRSKRMFNSSIELVFLRRMIKKLIEQSSDKLDLREFDDIDINKANRVQLETMLIKLRNKIG